MQRLRSRTALSAGVIVTKVRSHLLATVYQPTENVKLIHNVRPIRPRWEPLRPGSGRGRRGYLVVVSWLKTATHLPERLCQIVVS